jgi:anti-sigma regulatory factor (Ser/Thr protein kinase)
MQSARSAVAPTVERIIGALRRVGLGADQRANLSVALAEALSNAAVHGNHLRLRSQVLITVEITPGKQVVVDIKDSGHGFDAGALSDPTEDSHILLPRGRGVFLMRRLVDHLEYRAPGNRVRLTMRTRSVRSSKAAS